MKYLTRILFLTLLMSFVSHYAKAGNHDTAVYIIDTVKSAVKWQCDKHYGFVPIKSGTIKTVDGTIVAGSFVMNMDSLKDEDIDYDLMRKTLHNTLRSEFFFDTKKYHTSEFHLDYAEPTGKNRHHVTGDLIVKGIDNCIEFDTRIVFRKHTFEAVSDTFYIDRLNWGITIYSREEAESDDSVIVSNEIYFTIQLFGAAKKE